MNKNRDHRLHVLALLIIGLLPVACGGILEVGIERPTPTIAAILPTQQPITAPPIPSTATPFPTEQPSEDPGPAGANQLDDNISGLALALAIHFNIRPEEIRFGIVEQTEKHAKGSISGGYFLAAREADAWVIVYDGQVAPSCVQIAPYDFPLNMVPECLDASNNLVRRTAAEAEPVSDETQAIQAALIEKTGIEAENLEFAVAQNTGTHAMGTLKHKDDVGGGYFIAAKVDDWWVIVYDGQATPSCVEIAPYDFPIDMVPECLDENNNLVVRTVNRTIPTKEVESGITIMGTVMDVSLSARIIMLQEPVEGFSVVALTEESELVSTDGDEITLRDIRPGMTIQTSGQPGESNALLASQVLLLP